MRLLNARLDDEFVVLQPKMQILRETPHAPTETETSEKKKHVTWKIDLKIAHS